MGHLAEVASNGGNSRVKAYNSSGQKAATSGNYKSATQGNYATGINTGTGTGARVNNAGGATKIVNNAGGGGTKDNAGSNTSYAPVVQTEDPNAIIEATVLPVDEEYDDYNDRYDAYLAAIEAQNSAYAKALAAQQAAIQAGRDQSVNTLNQQKETTGTEYANLYRQLYIDSMKSKKNLDQTLALQGLTGGASESAVLGIDTDYAENLASGKAKEQAAYNDIATAIANAQLASSAEEATAIANNAKESTANYTSAMQNLLNLAATERQNRISAANSQASENRQYAYNYALALLNAGQMPSSELLSSAGISSADAASLISGKTSSSSSGSKGSLTNANGVYNSAINLAQTDGRNKALSYLSDAYNQGLITQAQYVQYKTVISQSF